jgi:hypothetical protein
MPQVERGHGCGRSAHRQPANRQWHVPNSEMARSVGIGWPVRDTKRRVEPRECRHGLVRRFRSCRCRAINESLLPLLRTCLLRQSLPTRSGANNKSY